MLVHQDERYVRIYRRSDTGEWRTAADGYRDAQSFELPTLAAPIAVSEIYDGILDGDGRSVL